MKKGSIFEIQKYVTEKIREYGFEDETLEETLLIMAEECGELIKACRGLGIGHVKDNEKIGDIGGELSDNLFMIFSVAYVLKIDLEESFWKKMAEIDKRKYGRVKKKTKEE